MSFDSNRTPTSAGGVDRTAAGITPDGARPTPESQRPADGSTG